MSLEGKLRATEIVMQCGMISDPGFYSGRGATLSDLNGEILTKIYQSITSTYGTKAARNFVAMIDETPVLSATDFLLNLYKLEANEWKWDVKLLSEEKGIFPTSEGSAFGTICSVLGGHNRRDETWDIRRDFSEKRVSTVSNFKKAKQQYRNALAASNKNI